MATSIDIYNKLSYNEIKLGCSLAKRKPLLMVLITKKKNEINERKYLNDKYINNLKKYYGDDILLVQISDESLSKALKRINAKESDVDIIALSRFCTDRKEQLSEICKKFKIRDTSFNEGNYFINFIKHHNYCGETCNNNVHSIN